MVANLTGFAGVTGVCSRAEEERTSIKQRYLSLKEISIYLGLSPKTLYIWAEEGRIPGYKFGRVWRFDKEEIDNFVKSHYASPNICYNKALACAGFERKGG